MNNWALSYIYDCHFTMRSSKEEKWDSGRPGIFWGHKQSTSHARVVIGMLLDCMIPLGILL